MKFKLTRLIGIVIILILLTGTFTAVLFTVVGSTSQSDQLQALVQVAISSRDYAVSVVNTASAQGLNVTSAEVLLSAGNSSLAKAQSYLLSNSNTSGGIQLARDAMDDFTEAATRASLSLGVTSSFSLISADLDSVVAANNTAIEFNNTIVLACQNVPTNASYASLFQQECVSGKNMLLAAITDLNQARVSLIAAEGQSSPNLTKSEILISYAKSNISTAAGAISQLSVFDYARRAQQYLSGPFAQLMNSANNTVTSQASLVSSFGSQLSSFQTSSSQQFTAISSITDQAASISTSTSTSLSDLNIGSTALQNEQMILVEANTNMTDFYSQIPTGLPTNLISELQTDILNVQSNITATNLAISNLESEVSLFSQTNLSSIPNYAIAFQTSASSLETDNQALVIAFTNLQNDLNTIVSLYSFLSILVNWQSTLSLLGQGLNSEISNTDSSLNTAANDLNTLGTSSTSFANSIQSSASQIEVSTELVSNVSSTVSLEGKLLNSTAIAQLKLALNSILATAQSSTNFISTSQALLQSNTSEVGSAASTLSSQGNSLKSQISSTIASMNSVSAYLSSDLQVRSNALTNANVDASNALRLFDDLQVSQGASLLTQANIELQVAAQVY